MKNRDKSVWQGRVHYCSDKLSHQRGGLRVKKIKNPHIHMYIYDRACENVPVSMYMCASVCVEGV